MSYTNRQRKRDIQRLRAIFAHSSHKTSLKRAMRKAHAEGWVVDPVTQYIARKKPWHSSRWFIPSLRDGKLWKWRPDPPRPSLSLADAVAAAKARVKEIIERRECDTDKRYLYINVTDHEDPTKPDAHMILARVRIQPHMMSRRKSHDEMEAVFNPGHSYAWRFPFRPSIMREKPIALIESIVRTMTQ